LESRSKTKRFLAGTGAPRRQKFILPDGHAAAAQVRNNPESEAPVPAAKAQRSEAKPKRSEVLMANDSELSTGWSPDTLY
jgi:hypothetical protein